jgi:hypothetical protein
MLVVSVVVANGFMVDEEIRIDDVIVAVVPRGVNVIVLAIQPDKIPRVPLF